MLSAPNVAAAATVPSAMVSGSPMPSRRSGRPTSRRRWRRSMREASQNSTSASVASASVRTVPLVLSRSIPSSTLGPTSRPTATKTIAGVIGEPSSRRDTAATPSKATATMASDHSMRHRTSRSGGSGRSHRITRSGMPRRLGRSMSSARLILQQANWPARTSTRWRVRSTRPASRSATRPISSHGRCRRGDQCPGLDAQSAPRRSTTLRSLRVFASCSGIYFVEPRGGVSSSRASADPARCLAPHGGAALDMVGTL